MSLSPAVLTPANAASIDQAVAVYMEEAPGTPDDSGELEAYAWCRLGAVPQSWEDDRSYTALACTVHARLDPGDGRDGLAG
jgi:hypothetical protein